MALVTGGRSTLNPDAPLFIPAAFRQVEDFSPEWWQLVTTSTWYRDYWLSQHQDEDGFYFDGGDVADLLPDTLDLGAAEDFSIMEDQFEEFIRFSEIGEENKSPGNGFELGADALMNNRSLLKSLEKRGSKSTVEPAKYAEKAAKSLGSKCSPRRIQQPR